MTTALALEYIPRRMKELGYGNNYHIRMRTIMLWVNDCIEINAHNELYILVEDNANVKIESDFGVYDLSYTDINEIFYEHQGTIYLGNYSGTERTLLKFIQVIPDHPICETKDNEPCP